MTLLDKLKQIIVTAEAWGEHELSLIENEIHSIHDKIFGSSATVKPLGSTDPDNDGDNDTDHPNETGE